MKALLLSTEDAGSGSTRAAYRLHRSFRAIGIDSRMLVQTKHSDDTTVIGSKSSSGAGQVVAGMRVVLDRLPLKLYRQREKSSYSLQWLPNKLTPAITQINPDIVHLHWICQGYLQIETLSQFQQPIVWTLRDMWAFTGGCHYNFDCEHYTNSCGSCPQLGSRQDWDLSRWVWKRKAKAWKNLNLTIVALSSWLADCAAASSLFRDVRIEVIPNGIDTRQYRPFDRQLSRNLLNLPQDKQLILFGAVNSTSDPRKGFHLLQPALQNLRQLLPDDAVELIVFGASQPEKPPELGFRCRYLGQLNDDLSLALLYSAADVFVAPSIQENLANTVLEALACGLPCVAFAIGGMPDLIVHQQNGYLATPYQIDDLTKGILWVMENQERHQRLSTSARQRIEQSFTMETPARRYLSLFNDLLSAKSYSGAK
ncbi:glycosyl transferase [filamentous cyanobacterium CCP2]|nr:glycosyl transferase [filamentous cyanobacterium CCP2]